MVIYLVRPSGLEPLTYSLEGCCSIQLSYGRIPFFSKLNLVVLSGRQDSNLRPPAPKAGALTGLRYAPIMPIRDLVYLNTT